MNMTVKSLVFLLFTMVSTHGAQIEKIHTNDEPSSCWSMASSLVSLAKETSNAIFVPDETPTWGRALTKTGMGMLGHLLKYSAFDYSGRNVSVYNVCTWTSTTLLLNGLKEITYLVFDSITSPNLKHMARDSSKSHFNKDKYESLKKKRDNDLSRLSRAGELLLNSTLLLHGEYLFMLDALKINQLGVSLLSASYPKHLSQLCPQTNWFCRPIHTPMFILLYAASLAYNFYDLSYFKDPSFLTRGQIPLLELVTNLARTDASANFARSYGISTRYLKQFELWDQNKYNLYVKAKKFYLFDRMIHRGMCDHGNVMIYSNFLLVLKNAGNYLWEMTTDEDQNIVLEPIYNESRRQRRHSQNPSLTEDQHLMFSTLPPPENVNLTAPTQTAILIPKKPKIKKKGAPGKPRYNNDDHHQKNNSSSTIITPADIDLRRTQALIRLQELRRLYPVNVSLIDKELRKACKFLNGVVIPVTGSVYKLQWSIGPNNFAMNFETPHGQDSTQYKGNKLDRVLSVLETCYLVGLDKDQIEKLTRTYNLGHLWRLDKFMYYIFSNRASGGARL